MDMFGDAARKAGLEAKAMEILREDGLKGGAMLETISTSVHRDVAAWLEERVARSWAEQAAPDRAPTASWSR